MVVDIVQELKRANPNLVYGQLHLIYFFFFFFFLGKGVNLRLTYCCCLKIYSLSLEGRQTQVLQFVKIVH